MVNRLHAFLLSFLINIKQEGTAKWAQVDATSPTKKLPNLNKKRRSRFMDLVSTLTLLKQVVTAFE